MRKNYYLLLCYLACFLSAGAQNPITDAGLKYTPTLPPPPEAASLGKFGQTPVSLFTGVPQIAIPIYTIKLHNVDLPLSLDYHAGGIRASETASVVGLGWALQAGGLISSTVVGGADFSLRGYVRGAGRLGPIPTDRPLVPLVLNGAQRITNADYDFAMLATGCARVSMTGSTAPAYGYDTQPDIFQYSFAGRSGQFFHTQDGSAHPMPYEPLAIKRLPGNFNAFETGGGYTITDEKGTVYTFDQPEFTATTIRKYGAPTNPTDELNPHSTVYHLSRIQNVQGESITFHYDTLTYRYRNVTSRTRYLQLAQNYCGPRAESRTESFTVVNGLVLTEIRSSLGHVVQFEYSACRRLDLTGSRALTAIVIQEARQSRRFELQQAYYNGPATLCALPTDQPDYASLPELYRLQLLGVTEVGKPPYRVVYADAPMPQRLTAQEDHWGFINGYGNSSNFPAEPAYGFYDGYSREPDSTAMMAGLVRELHYPTGGYTRFAFEPNGFRIPVDSLTVFGTKAVQFYANDSVNNYTLHGKFRIKGYSAASVRVDFDGPPCSQVSPQFSVRISDGSQLVGLYCGTSPPGGQTGNAGGGPPNGYSPNVDYDITVSKYGQCEGSYFRLVWQEPYKVARRGRSQFTGGVRIRETQDFDGIHLQPALRQHYYYTTSMDTLQSSGMQLQAVPTYTTLLQEPVRRDPHQIDPSKVTDVCNFYLQTTTTQVPLGSIKGSNIAYTSVLVAADKGGTKGLTQHKFSFAPDYNPYAGYPFTQPTSHDWERGLPVERIDFGYNESTRAFYPLKRVRTHFTSQFTPPTVPSEELANYTPAARPNEVHAIGLNLLIDSPEYFVDANNSGVPAGTVGATFHNQVYKLLSVWQYKDSEQIFTYDAHDSTAYSLVTTRYRYANPQHAQPTTITTSLQASDSLLTRFSYPLDFDTTVVSTPAAQAIRGLARTHQVAIPLETQRMRMTPTSVPRVIGGELVEYSGQWPSKVRVLEVTRPLANLQPARIVGGGLITDAHYTDAIYLPKYDGRGNALEVQRPHALPTASLWNAVTGEPLATAKNSFYNQIAATSFEPTATGRWQYDSTGTHLVNTSSHTGRWSYLLDAAAPIRRLAIPLGTYDLSIWVQGVTAPQLTSVGGQLLGGWQLVARGPDNWVQFRAQLHFTVTGSLTLQMPSRLLVDDLQLHPVGAQVTTYTYEPFVGLTSQTDPNGRTVSYEYDALGRLVRTRDEQGRILSQQQYHYAGAK